MSSKSRQYPLSRDTDFQLKGRRGLNSGAFDLDARFAASRYVGSPIFKLNGFGSSGVRFRCTIFHAQVKWDERTNDNGTFIVACVRAWCFVSV